MYQLRADMLGRPAAWWRHAAVAKPNTHVVNTVCTPGKGQQPAAEEVVPCSPVIAAFAAAALSVLSQQAEAHAEHPPGMLCSHHPAGCLPTVPCRPGFQSPPQQPAARAHSERACAARLNVPPERSSSCQRMQGRSVGSIRASPVCECQRHVSFTHWPNMLL